MSSGSRSGFDGGGYRAGGKAMFDSEGNLWVGDNFTIGWQGRDDLWQGNATKFDPNGRPLSPITTGFADNAWLTSYGGQTITVFDKNGKPLTPPEGITFDGKLGLMQGIIVVPGTGDVWALGVSKGQLLLFPGGDYRAASCARAARSNPASHSWARSISLSTRRTESG